MSNDIEPATYPVQATLETLVAVSGLVSGSPPTSTDSTDPEYVIQFFDYDTGNGIVAAWGARGDDFARVVIDAGGNFYFGNGTFDPYTSADAAHISLQSASELHLFRGTAGLEIQAAQLSLINGATTLSLMSDLIAAHADVVYDATFGPVIADDTDGHTYRLTTHNGAVIAVVVT